MLGPMRGEAVTVVRPRALSTDDLGETECGEPERTVVDDVLVSPGATSDMGADRPAGAVSSLTLYFPKTYQEELRGCSVVARGDTYRVVGDPHPYAPENVPGAYNYTVEARRADG